jgi:hypothetical protein
MRDVLGELIYEGKGNITGSRVLDGGKSLIEYSLIENGKFKKTEVIITSTFWTVPSGRNTVYGEAQAVINAKGSKEIVTYRGYGVGHFVELGKTIFRGTNFYKTSPNGKLSFLNNVVGALEAEAYENHHSGKVWEWK